MRFLAPTGLVRIASLEYRPRIGDRHTVDLFVRYPRSAERRQDLSCQVAVVAVGQRLYVPAASVD